MSGIRYNSSPAANEVLKLIMDSIDEEPFQNSVDSFSLHLRHYTVTFHVFRDSNPNLCHILINTFG